MSTECNSEYKHKGNMYYHSSGEYRIRARKGRAFEVEFAERPSLWISTKTTEFEKADAFVKARIHSGRRYLPDEMITLKDFSRGFFTETGEGSFRTRNELFGIIHSDEYYQNYDSYLRNYIIPRFGNYDIRRITDVMIEDWYVGLRSKRDPSKILDSSSRVKVLYCFSFIMKEAKRRGIISINPCDSVTKVKKGKPEKPRRIFTDEEIARLFPEDRDKLMEIWDGSLMWALYFSIMVDTGWRPGEIAALTKSKLKFNGAYSTSSINSHSRKMVERIKTTDHGKSVKLGTFSSYTMELLHDYLQTLEGEDLFRIKSGYFYINLDNKKLRNACEKAGVDIKERTQYCFRHSFDTYMLDSLGENVEEADVRELMAHTGYRPEYDHRTPEQMLFKLQKVRPVIDARRKVADE